MGMKRITLLGATGSIGLRTLDLVSSFPEEFQVAGLAARGSNIELIADLCRKYSPRAVALLDAGALDRLARLPPAPPPQLLKRAGRPGARGVKLLPVDSEHSAVFQCLAGHNRADVHRILLTASGGPFRETPKAQLATMTVEDALKHPTWKMGAKITIDSATLMNKGLEIIEARWLFEVAPDQVQVVVHPQSIVHSMVEYLDGSVIAQLGVADMGVPILYALTYPERRPTPAARLDLTRVGQLTFYEPDTDKFPCLRLAREALEHGGGAPVVLNAANEIAVAGFLDRRLGFTEIARLIEWALDDARPGAVRSLDECVAIDAETRRRVQRRIDAHGGGRSA